MTQAVSGWRLFGALSLAVLAMVAVILATGGDGVAAIRLGIRATARTSFALFLLAFIAAPLARRWPSALASYLVRNRRFLGLAFAVSHGTHLALIVRFARLDPVGFGDLVPMVTIIGGSVTYAFIAAMAATSFDLTARAIGPRAWRLLHGVGIWVIAGNFTVSFAKRITDPFYWPFAALLLVAIALRLLTRRR